MKVRDASDVNAEFARQMQETARARAQFSHTPQLPELDGQTAMDLMRETQQIAKWDRWILPLSMTSLSCSALTLFLVWQR